MIYYQVFYFKSIKLEYLISAYKLRLIDQG